MIGHIDAVRRRVDAREIDARRGSRRRVGESLHAQGVALSDLGDMALAVLQLEHIAVRVHDRIGRIVDQAGDRRVAAGRIGDLIAVGKAAAGKIDRMRDGIDCIEVESRRQRFRQVRIGVVDQRIAILQIGGVERNRVIRRID